MNSARISRAITAMVLMAGGAIASLPATAADDGGWYIGANAGQSRAKIDDSRIEDGLLAAGFTTTAFKDDDRHFGYKLFGGYQFNRFFALEAGYFDLGQFGFIANTAPPGALTGNIKLKGTNFDAVGLLPFTSKFSAFARVGYDYTYAKDRFVGYDGVVALDPDPSRHSSNYKFGFGLQYAVSRSWGMRAEAERYRVNDAVGNKGDIDLFSVGVLYRFGGAPPAPPPPVVREPPPAPPPEPPTPAPVIVSAPPKVKLYCSILEIQFEINQDGIRREMKEKLAVVGTFLAKYPGTTAAIEGHTDNVGSAENNMALSQRRADSVVKYLVDSVHIDASRLSAVGYGDTRPIADNRTEEGKRANRRIDAVVACATDVVGLHVKSERMTMALTIEFEQTHADVDPRYRDELQTVATFLNANPAVTATVEGHAANAQASADAVQKISELRAQNVVNYLVDNFGIDRSRLTARGYGNQRRVAYNTSEEGQQENRRVNIIINYPK